MKTRKLLAFTLVEMLVVVIILAIICAIAIPKFENASQRSTEAAVRTQLGLLRTAETNFYNDTGWWPASLNDLSSNTCPAFGLNGGGHQKAIYPTTWKGPYLLLTDNDYPGWIAYNTTPPNTGNVYCPLSGNSLDGVPYSSW